MNLLYFALFVLEVFLITPGHRVQGFKTHGELKNGYECHT
ncbi:hypothetical protein Cabys_3475 [Caldithrix abyssi DSM 13497]|uniref:Uncharacterized protein n=1 Tax=Caldithrix abyssi DSM 13497 TaxID=880073 RepID=A0A1J1CC01_CALAY|nr:hypothetical protein Cabys_3475 [Caldithrix abyssi DSM 13497]